MSVLRACTKAVYKYNGLIEDNFDKTFAIYNGRYDQAQLAAI